MELYHSFMEDQLDLDIALQKLHELGLEDGDLGYAYYSQVAALLKSAPTLKARVIELERQIADLLEKQRRSQRASAKKAASSPQAKQ